MSQTIRRLLGGVGYSHILTLARWDIARDLAAKDVLDKDLGGIVSRGWGIKSNHISCCSRTCIHGVLSSRTHHDVQAPCDSARYSPLYLEAQPHGHQVLRGYGGMLGWCVC